MNKTNVEAIIKRSSFVIMVLSLLAAAFCLVSGIEMEKIQSGNLSNYILGLRLSCFIYVAVFAAAAVIFFRIFRSGRPFTRGNVWAVRGIAGLFVVKIIIQVILEGQELGLLKAFLFRGSQSVFFAALFLVIAEIIRYGKLLQTESDETL
ncbi:hypothetical protein [Ruminococcus sp.]|uniref:hypothetical protein n=1 Tax=Ruminococcus sp. TaxID=41978 RepID=UPI0025E756EF|nr:hypothetical protein [Ruminococcus sp.]